MKNLFGFCIAVAVLGVWVQGGCYNPDFPNGTVNCSATGKACPDGFECRTNICWSKAEGTGGVTGNGGTSNGGSGSGGVIGNGGVIGSGGANMCVGPFAVPQCQGATIPGGNVCDPVCQAGCACNQRCNMVGDSSRVACVPPTGDKRPGDSCSTAVDDCSPGLICLAEFNEQTCGRHCYRHCRNDNDCLNRAHCTVELTAGDSVVGRICDNPPEDCSPMFGAANCVTAGRPFPNFGCYIAGSQFPNESVCDCAGTTVEDAPCAFERECKPGLICADSQDGQGPRCRRVCPIANTAAAKAAAQQICGIRRCVAFHNSPRFGFCEPIR